MKKKIILFMVTVLVFGACNYYFLEKSPIESQTEATAFKTYNNFQTYAW